VGSGAAGAGVDVDVCTGAGAGAATGGTAVESGVGTDSEITAETALGFTFPLLVPAFASVVSATAAATAAARPTGRAEPGTKPRRASASSCLRPRNALRSSCGTKPARTFCSLRTLLSACTYGLNSCGTVVEEEHRNCDVAHSRAVLSPRGGDDALERLWVHYDAGCSRLGAQRWQRHCLCRFKTSDDCFFVVDSRPSRTRRSRVWTLLSTRC
jgi:hypothetical protein